MYNTIVAQNTDSAGGDDIGGTGITMASSNNMVGYDDSGTVAASTNPIVLDGASADLGALANNGSPTQTIALLAGSPAIDAGSNTWADTYGVTTDQRGVRGGQPDALNAGQFVDIGAYEASSSYLVTTTADSTAIGTLRSAILWANASTNANPANLTPAGPAHQHDRFRHTGKRPRIHRNRPGPFRRGVHLLDNRADSGPACARPGRHHRRPQPTRCWPSG